MTDIHRGVAHAHALVGALDAPWAYRGASSMSTYETGPQQDRIATVELESCDPTELVLYDIENGDAWVQSDGAVILKERQ